MFNVRFLMVLVSLFFFGCAGVDNTDTMEHEDKKNVVIKKDVLIENSIAPEPAPPPFEDIVPVEPVVSPAEPVKVPTPPPPPLPVEMVVEIDSGNENLGKVNVGAGTEGNVQIHSHSYKVINHKDELYLLPKISTYVILPKKLSSSSSKVYQRYTRVLELIQQVREVDPKVFNDHNRTGALDNENLFVLFSHDQNQTVTLENYDYKLADSVLRFFRTKYNDSLFRKDGPYLITVVQNVWNHDRDFSFLYVNLSQFNRSAIDEIVGTYKERLITQGIDGVGSFEQFHSKLLTFVTNFNEDIQIFQTVVAGGFD